MPRKTAVKGGKLATHKTPAEVAKAPAPRKSAPQRRIDDSIRDQYEAYTTEDEKLLQAMPHPDDFTRSDTWRVLRIMGEFIEGFDKLANVGKAVTVFDPRAPIRTIRSTPPRSKSGSCSPKPGSRRSPGQVRGSWKRPTRARNSRADGASAATSNCRSNRGRIRRLRRAAFDGCVLQEKLFAHRNSSARCRARNSIGCAGNTSRRERRCSG